MSVLNRGMKITTPEMSITKPKPNFYNRDPGQSTRRATKEWAQDNLYLFQKDQESQFQLSQRSPYANTGEVRQKTYMAKKLEGGFPDYYGEGFNRQNEQENQFNPSVNPEEKYMKPFQSRSTASLNQVNHDGMVNFTQDPYQDSVNPKTFRGLQPGLKMTDENKPGVYQPPHDINSGSERFTTLNNPHTINKGAYNAPNNNPRSFQSLRHIIG
uniref:Uncharacterized protein n=1 Tax=Euplotes crassus TaxID=5936 RepID=A0A7S3KKM3_EUPCR|mmetsp:Transcript_32285/g.31701  ORF Transcript_32285/g.31701 Transcript_32285/m.31701 type:complete len:213 (+) Transcript_32285:246-884(+)